MTRRRRPLTPEQLAEIQEAAQRGPDGKPLAETMRTMIKGTATAPDPQRDARRDDAVKPGRRV